MLKMQTTNLPYARSGSVFVYALTSDTLDVLSPVGASLSNNSGVALPGATVNFMASTVYAFTISLQDYIAHPFYLSTQAIGGRDPVTGMPVSEYVAGGVSYTLSANGQWVTLIFTPSVTTPSTLYYCSLRDRYMGGNLGLVVPTTTTTTTTQPFVPLGIPVLIYVTVNPPSGDQPASYDVRSDTVGVVGGATSTPITRGQISVQYGQTYVFYITASDNSAYPLYISTAPDQIATTVTSDDVQYSSAGPWAVVTLIARADLSYPLYYSCATVAGAGGQIALLAQL